MSETIIHWRTCAEFESHDGHAWISGWKSQAKAFQQARRWATDERGQRPYRLWIESTTGSEVDLSPYLPAEVNEGERAQVNAGE